MQIHRSMSAETVNLLGARNKEIRRLKSEQADRDAVIEALEADRVIYQGMIAVFVSIAIATNC